MTKRSETGATIDPALLESVRALQLDPRAVARLPAIYLPLAERLADAAQAASTPLIVGINGAQGAGKTTLCRLLEVLLARQFDLKVVSFSIDDIYLTRHERAQLAATVHPLLATRGVPGTHDTGLGHDLFDRLCGAASGEMVAVPSFDKATDDRRPAAAWRQVEGPFDLVLFEGWCVGARPQPEMALSDPVNRLEAEEDTDGTWRRFVNARLAGPYTTLFARLDLLVMLQIPDFSCVFEWRAEQERRLAKKTQGSGIMDETALQRFIMHYERLTRHQLAEMPLRADIVLELNRDHQVDRLVFSRGTPHEA